MLKAAQYEDNNMTERAEEHSGQGPFADQALETKKSALQKVFTEAEDERQKNALWPPALRVQVLMPSCRLCEVFYLN